MSDIDWNSEPRCLGCDGTYDDHLAGDRGGCSGDLPEWWMQVRGKLAQATKERDEWIKRAANDENWRTHLTARAEKAERERDELRTQWQTEYATGAEYQRLWAVETKRAEKAELDCRDWRDQAIVRGDQLVERMTDVERQAERDTAEAIAAWLETWLDERHSGLVELTPGQAAYEDGFNAAVEQVRAWRKESDRG